MPFWAEAAAWLVEWKDYWDNREAGEEIQDKFV